MLRSFSRQRLSNHNPCSESLFRTVKYRPDASTRCWRRAGKVWINKPPIEAEPILAPPLIQAARVAAKECHFSWQRGRMA